MSELFDKKGEINAQDKKDALRQLVKYASIVSENEPSNVGIAGKPSFTEEQREALLRKALMTQEGKLALGQAMANPIRRNLDYQGVGRKALIVDPLVDSGCSSKELQETQLILGESYCNSIRLS